MKIKVNENRINNIQFPGHQTPFRGKLGKVCTNPSEYEISSTGIERLGPIMGHMNSLDPFDAKATFVQGTQLQNI